jgi:hypothetical protein
MAGLAGDIPAESVRGLKSASTSHTDEIAMAGLAKQNKTSRTGVATSAPPQPLAAPDIDVDAHFEAVVARATAKSKGREEKRKFTEKILSFLTWLSIGIMLYFGIAYLGARVTFNIVCIVIIMFTVASRCIGVDRITEND